MHLALFVFADCDKKARTLTRSMVGAVKECLMIDRSYEDVYQHYLQKFEKLFGALKCGETVQYQGKLIQKLDYDEFVDKWKEFRGLDTYLCNVMSKGATLNDDIYRTYQGLSAQVLEKPKDFMTL